MGLVDFYSLKPTEKRRITHDFSSKMIEGVYISSCTASAVVRKTGASATTTVLGGATPTVTIDKQMNTVSVDFTAQAGTSGTWYEVTFTAVLSSTSILIDKIRVFIE